MAKKKQTLKPDRPLASILFSKEGTVTPSTEHLPRTQDELELSIGIKFIAALNHFFGIKLNNLKKGHGRGDLICESRSSEPIKIQVVEIINQELRQLIQMRQTYQEAISNNPSQVLRGFSGCRITLTDNGTRPHLPSARSKEVINCTEEIIKNLKDFSSSIETLPVGMLTNRWWLIGKNRFEITASAERLFASNSTNHYLFSWTGGGPIYTVGQSRKILSNAIGGKIKKNYSKPSEEFWLLAYSTDTIFRDNNDPDVIETIQLLNSQGHPFDQVWYFYPYPNRDLGHTMQIWPQHC